MKIEGKRLIKEDFDRLELNSDNQLQLKIKYNNPNDRYKLLYKNKGYDLVKSDDYYLIWNIPEEIQDSVFRIRVRAFDNDAISYTTNQVLIENTTNKQVVSPMSTMALLNEITPADLLNEYYVTYDMTSEHDVIPISKRKISPPKDFIIVVEKDTNSQLLMFKIDRFYNSIDLLQKAIGINYKNANKQDGKAIAINLDYDDETITFGWLLDENISEKFGTVEYIIEFLGYNEFNELYRFQSLPSTIEVNKGLIVSDLETQEKFPTIIEDFQIKLRALELMIEEIKEYGGSGEGRNFTTNPIKLASEVTGILPSSKIDTSLIEDVSNKANANLSNVSNANFLAKANSAGVGVGGGGDGGSGIAMVSKPGYNIYDPSLATVGYEVYSDGRISAYSSSVVTGYVPITERGIYVEGFPATTAGSSGRNAAFYDSNKQFISLSSSFLREQSDFMYYAPENAAFINISIHQRSFLEPKDYDFSKIKIYNGHKRIENNYSLFADSFNGEKILNNRKVGLGKKLLLFGDSITATATFNDDGSNYADGKRHNWPVLAMGELGLESMTNYALSGASYAASSTATTMLQIPNQVSAAINNGIKADVIGFFGGSNDNGILSAKYGTFDAAIAKETLDDLDKSLVYESLRWCFWNIRTHYPNAIIFCSTPIHRHDAEIKTILLTALKTMANRYGIIVIDANAESGIVRDFEIGGNHRFLSDGLHPNRAGINLLSRYICSVMSRYLAMA